MAASGKQRLIRIGWACALVASVSCVHPTPSATPLPGSFPRDYHRAELLAADTVRQALVRIVTHCKGQKWVGTGYVVAEDRFGLSREAFVMTARHVVMPKLCEGKKKRVELSGPSIVTQTIDDELDKHLVFSEKSATTAAGAPGLDVAVLKVVARETVTKLPLDELPPPNASGVAHIWGFPERSGSSEATYREGKISIGSRQAGDLRYETDALRHSDQGMSGGPVLWQQHGLVAALVSGREDLASGVSDLPYVLVPMSTVLDHLPESLRRRLGVLPRHAFETPKQAEPQLSIKRPKVEREVQAKLLSWDAGREAPLVILRGGPGMGKSILLRQLAVVLQEKQRKKILLLDLSGKGPKDALSEILNRLRNELPSFSDGYYDGFSGFSKRASSTTERRLADECKREMRQHRDLVIILDNATWTHIPNWFRDAMSSTPTIIASRNSLIGSAVSDVGPLERIECIEYFRTRLHESEKTPSFEWICERLGDHPAAIAQAANLLETKRGGWTIGRLIEKLKNRRLSTLSEGADPAETIPVLADESLNSIPEPTRADARTVALVLGRLGDAPVPRWLLEKILLSQEILGNNIQRIDHAVDELIRVGLLDPSNDSNDVWLQFQTLLWEWARDMSMNQNPKNKYIQETVLDILKNNRDDQFRREFVPHLLQCQSDALYDHNWQIAIGYSMEFNNDLTRFGLTDAVLIMADKASVAYRSQQGK